MINNLGLPFAPGGSHQVPHPPVYACAVDRCRDLMQAGGVGIPCARTRIPSPHVYFIPTEKMVTDGIGISGGRQGRPRTRVQ